jgi:hypothetical protein
MMVERNWCSTEGKMTVVVGEVARVDIAWSMPFFSTLRGMTSNFYNDKSENKECFRVEGRWKGIDEGLRVETWWRSASTEYKGKGRDE